MRVQKTVDPKWPEVPHTIIGITPETWLGRQIATHRGIAKAKPAFKPDQDRAGAAGPCSDADLMHQNRGDWLYSWPNGQIGISGRARRLGETVKKVRGSGRGWHVTRPSSLGRVARLARAMMPAKLPKRQPSPRMAEDTGHGLTFRGMRRLPGTQAAWADCPSYPTQTVGRMGNLPMRLGGWRRRSVVPARSWASFTSGIGRVGRSTRGGACVPDPAGSLRCRLG